MVCAIEDKYYDYGILGLGKEPLANPDDINSYKPGSLWEKSFYNESNQLADKDKIGKTLMVPMDSICVASYTGNSDYMFYRIGGVSWTMPYVAGLYALCCQVKPDITPEEFWKEAMSTGDVINIENNDIANPEKLIKALLIF